MNTEELRKIRNPYISGLYAPNYVDTGRLLAHIDELQSKLDAATRPLEEVPEWYSGLKGSVRLSHDHFCNDLKAFTLDALNADRASRREANLVSSASDMSSAALESGATAELKAAEPKPLTVASGPVVATVELVRLFEKSSFASAGRWDTAVSDGLNSVFSHLHNTGQLSQATPATDHLPDAAKMVEPPRFQEAERISKQVVCSNCDGMVKDMADAMLSLIAELRKDGAK